MKNFQLILLVIFGSIAVVAVLIFSGVFGGNSGGTNDGTGGTVVLWGPFPESAMRQVFDSFEQTETSFSIQYVEKSLGTFENDLVQAIARGLGPDIILIPEFLLSKHEDIIAPLETDVLTERQFLDYFVDGSRVFTGGGHIFAFPFAIDPVVMYWNRAIFQDAGLPQVPTTWNDVAGLTRRLSTKNDAGEIVQSTIALGGVENVAHIKEIISAFILQTGDRIVVRSETGKPQVVLGAEDGPASIFGFYNQFSNPRSSAYSWNGSLPYSRTTFSGEALAMYLGTASDYEYLKESNPHLDFDVALLPQLASGGVRSTFANVYGLALLRTAPNSAAAYAVMQKIAFGETPKFIAEHLKIPPARSDVIAAGTTDPAMSVFFQSAVIARSWLDPNYAATSQILINILRSVTTGKLAPAEAVSRWSGLIQEEFNKIRL